MEIYLLIQDVNNDYDTYDSCVVAAESEDDARTIHPSRFVTHMRQDKWMGTYSGGPNKGKEYQTENVDAGHYYGTWIPYSDRDKIKVKRIGLAHPSIERGVICASFNAG